MRMMIMNGTGFRTFGRLTDQVGRGDRGGLGGREGLDKFGTAARDNEDNSTPLARATSSRKTFESEMHIY